MLSRRYEEVLSGWDLKSRRGTSESSQQRTLENRWSCGFCSFNNDSLGGTCEVCGLVSDSRKYILQRLAAASEAKERQEAELSQQKKEMFDDLEDDDEDSRPRSVQISSLRNMSTRLENLLTIPTRGHMHNLIRVVPAELLIQCLSYLQDARDLMNLSFSSKFFSYLIDDDTLWWPLHFSFINEKWIGDEATDGKIVQGDSSAVSTAASDVPREMSPVRGSHSNGRLLGESISRISAPNDTSRSRGTSAQVPTSSSRAETWICDSCQLTQALATSTHCEMCQAPRPLNAAQSSQEATAGQAVSSRVDQSFTIIKSAEQLAALWAMGRRQSDAWISSTESRRRTLSEDATFVDSNLDSSTDGASLLTPTSPSLKKAQASEPVEKTNQGTCPQGGTSNQQINDLVDWPYHIGLSGVPFELEQGSFNVRRTFLPRSAGKWFFRCKIACIERDLRQRWQALHRGWEWIRKDLRQKLRHLWRTLFLATKGGTTQLQRLENVADSARDNTPLTAPSSSARYEAADVSYAEAIMTEANELRKSANASATLRRALRKLASINWVLCYESLKAELILQAEALARDMKSLSLVTGFDSAGNHRCKGDGNGTLPATDDDFIGDALGSLGPPSWLLNSGNSSASSSSSSSVSATPKVSSDFDLREIKLRKACLTYLSNLVRGCLIFIRWADEIEENCGQLNEKINRDRAKEHNGPGIGALSTKHIDERTGETLAGQDTPFVSDMALLALRNHLMLSHWISDAVLKCVDVLSAFAERSLKLKAGSSHSMTTTEAQAPHESQQQGSERKRRARSEYVRADEKEGAVRHEAKAKRIRVDSRAGDHSERSAGSSEPRDSAEPYADTAVDSVLRTLLRLYELCELLDVDDDALSPEQSTRTLFQRKVLSRLRRIGCLAPLIRQRTEELEAQAQANASADNWGYEEQVRVPVCHGGGRSVSSDNERGRVDTAGNIVPEPPRVQRLVTVRVTGVGAVASSRDDMWDHDPRSVLKRQLIALLDRPRDESGLL